MKLIKFEEISYSREIISPPKLSSDVFSSKNLFDTSNSWLLRPNQKFGG
jgi:hypothetical protein